MTDIDIEKTAKEMLDRCSSIDEAKWKYLEAVFKGAYISGVTLVRLYDLAILMTAIDTFYEKHRN